MGDTEKEARSWGWDGWVGGREVGCGHTSASVQSESAHLNDDVKDYCPQCVKRSPTDQTAKYSFSISLSVSTILLFSLCSSQNVGWASNKSCLNQLISEKNKSRAAQVNFRMKIVIFRINFYGHEFLEPKKTV